MAVPNTDGWTLTDALRAYNNVWVRLEATQAHIENLWAIDGVRCDYTVYTRDAIAVPWADCKDEAAGLCNIVAESCHVTTVPEPALGASIMIGTLLIVAVMRKRKHGKNAKTTIRP